MEEIWKDVLGYEGLYKVSNWGRVKTVVRRHTSMPNRIMKATNNPNGYPMIGLVKKFRGKQQRRCVHTLVLEAFIGVAPEGKECNHKDGNPTNNHLENLEWVTPKENLEHSYRVLGRRPSVNIRCGDQHHNTKLTLTKVKQIKHWLASGVSMREIGRRSGVHWTSIRSIRDGKTWAWVTNTTKKTGFRRLNNERS